MDGPTPLGHGLELRASEYAGVLISAHCAESSSSTKCASTKGKFPGLVSRWKTVSDKEMIWCLLGQAILQIGKIAWASAMPGLWSMEALVGLGHYRRRAAMARGS